MTEMVRWKNLKEIVSDNETQITAGNIPFTASTPAGPLVGMNRNWIHQLLVGIQDAAPLALVADGAAGVDGAALGFEARH